VWRAEEELFFLSAGEEERKGEQVLLIWTLDLGANSFFPAF
jgi:hypothetical protein